MPVVDGWWTWGLLQYNRTPFVISAVPGSGRLGNRSRFISPPALFVSFCNLDVSLMFTMCCIYSHCDWRPLVERVCSQLMLVPPSVMEKITLAWLGLIEKAF